MTLPTSGAIRVDGAAVTVKNIGGGERLVGSGTVQLTATKTPCTRVWIGAPTSNHRVGAQNTGNILVGGNATSNIEGGIALVNTNYTGFYIDIDDASKVYLTGFNAGDVVEFLVLGAADTFVQPAGEGGEQSSSSSGESSETSATSESSSESSESSESSASSDSSSDSSASSASSDSSSSSGD